MKLHTMIVKKRKKLSFTSSICSYMPVLTRAFFVLKVWKSMTLLTKRAILIDNFNSKNFHNKVSLKNVVAVFDSKVQDLI